MCMCIIQPSSALDQLLARKRSLAADMLKGSGDIEITEFSTKL